MSTTAAAIENHDKKFGLLAAWGRYPQIVAEALVAQGYKIYCLGVRDHVDPKLADLCEEFTWVGIAQMGKAMRFFKRHGVRRATMAGKFHKVLLNHPWIFLRHLPDLQAIKTFYPYFISTRKDRKDDTLLGAITDAFAKRGVDFRPATDYAPELLVKFGNVTSLSPSAAQQKDIEFGWQLAKEMGRLDVGQSVAIKSRAVLAIEAIEGTDECIRRAGGLCKKGNFTIVKVAKPQQDMRFDVPTVGPGTLQTMVESGARVLVIEAGRTIVLDREEFVDFAKRNKLIVVAYSQDSVSASADAA